MTANTATFRASRSVLKPRRTLRELSRAADDDGSEKLAVLRRVPVDVGALCRRWLFRGSSGLIICLTLSDPRLRD